MLWAAATVCLFGFFRVWELTVPSASSFDPIVHLSWGDFSVNSTVSPSMVRVHLKRSKCDQIGKGADVYIGRTADELCPVTAVLAYIAQHGGQAGAFFRFRDGTPLTKARFVSNVCRALTAAGVDCAPYSGHSFMSGATTVASLTGKEELDHKGVRALDLSVFMTYIQTPRDRLASFSHPLARV